MGVSRAVVFSLLMVMLHWGANGNPVDADPGLVPEIIDDIPDIPLSSNETGGILFPKVDKDNESIENDDSDDVFAQALLNPSETTDEEFIDLLESIEPDGKRETLSEETTGNEEQEQRLVQRESKAENIDIQSDPNQQQDDGVVPQGGSVVPLDDDVVLPDDGMVPLDDSIVPRDELAALTDRLAETKLNAEEQLTLEAESRSVDESAIADNTLSSEPDLDRALLAEIENNEKNATETIETNTSLENEGMANEAESDSPINSQENVNIVDSTEILGKQQDNLITNDLTSKDDVIENDDADDDDDDDEILIDNNNDDDISDDSVEITGVNDTGIIDEKDENDDMAIDNDDDDIKIDEDDDNGYDNDDEDDQVTDDFQNAGLVNMVDVGTDETVSANVINEDDDLVEDNDDDDDDDDGDDDIEIDNDGDDENDNDESSDEAEATDDIQIVGKLNKENQIDESLSAELMSEIENRVDESDDGNDDNEDDDDDQVTRDIQNVGLVSMLDVGTDETVSADATNEDDDLFDTNDDDDDDYDDDDDEGRSDETIATGDVPGIINAEETNETIIADLENEDDDDDDEIFDAAGAIDDKKDANIFNPEDQTDETVGVESTNEINEVLSDNDSNDDDNDDDDDQVNDDFQNAGPVNMLDVGTDETVSADLTNEEFDLVDDNNNDNDDDDDDDEESSDETITAGDVEGMIDAEETGETINAELENEDNDVIDDDENESFDNEEDSSILNLEDEIDETVGVELTNEIDEILNDDDDNENDGKSSDEVEEMESVAEEVGDDQETEGADNTEEADFGPFDNLFNLDEFDLNDENETDVMIKDKKLNPIESYATDNEFESDLLPEKDETGADGDVDFNELITSEQEEARKGDFNTDVDEEDDSEEKELGDLLGLFNEGPFENQEDLTDEDENMLPVPQMIVDDSARQNLNTEDMNTINSDELNSEEDSQIDEAEPENPFLQSQNQVINEYEVFDPFVIGTDDLNELDSNNNNMNGNTAPEAENNVAFQSFQTETMQDPSVQEDMRMKQLESVSSDESENNLDESFIDEEDEGKLRKMENTKDEGDLFNDNLLPGFLTSNEDNDFDEMDLNVESAEDTPDDAGVSIADRPISEYPFFTDENDNAFAKQADEQLENSFDNIPDQDMINTEFQNQDINTLTAEASESFMERDNRRIDNTLSPIQEDETNSTRSKKLQTTGLNSQATNFDDFLVGLMNGIDIINDESEKNNEDADTSLDIFEFPDLQNLDEILDNQLNEETYQAYPQTEERNNRIEPQVMLSGYSDEEMQIKKIENASNLTSINRANSQPQEERNQIYSQFRDALVGNNNVTSTDTNNSSEKNDDRLLSYVEENYDDDASNNIQNEDSNLLINFQALIQRMQNILTDFKPTSLTTEAETESFEDNSDQDSFYDPDHSMDSEDFNFPYSFINNRFTPKSSDPEVVENNVMSFEPVYNRIENEQRPGVLPFYIPFGNQESPSTEDFPIRKLSWQFRRWIIEMDTVSASVNGGSSYLQHYFSFLNQDQSSPNSADDSDEVESTGSDENGISVDTDNINEDRNSTNHVAEEDYDTLPEENENNQENETTSVLPAESMDEELPAEFIEESIDESMHSSAEVSVDISPASESSREAVEQDMDNDNGNGTITIEEHVEKIDDMYSYINTFLVASGICFGLILLLAVILIFLKSKKSTRLMVSKELPYKTIDEEKKETFNHQKLPEKGSINAYFIDV